MRKVMNTAEHAYTDDNDPTRYQPASETEATLVAEISKLCSGHKDGKAQVRHTREELKDLRLNLGAKLHELKALLVGAGRGGGWAPFLRGKLPLTTADRYVAEHEASLVGSEKKLPIGELTELTVDDVRQLARKMLPKVMRALTTQELVYEFVRELVWGIDVAEAWDTEKGFELPKVGSDDAADLTGETATQTSLMPPVTSMTQAVDLTQRQP
jgi:hypothetical protein